MPHCAELGLPEHVWEKRGDGKTKGEEKEGRGYERTKMGEKSECVELNSNLNAPVAVEHAWRISVVRQYLVIA